MPETKPDESGTPQVKDKRIVPPGILPKNMQTVVVSGVALVMVGVIAFSGRNVPKQRDTAPLVTSTPIDPNQTRIEEYKKRIEEQTRKLELEQAALAHNREGLATEASNTGVDGQSYRGAPAGYSYGNGNSQRNPIQAEKIKREYESLFASNVALTFRKEAQPADPTLSPENLAKLLSFYPALAAMQSASSPASGAAKPSTPTPSSNDRTLSKPEEPSVSRLTFPDSDPKEAKYRLFEGTVLETVLTNRLDSSFSGPVNCMVTTSVYSRDGQHLLVPQGSRILGEARKVEAFGETRLAVVFHRLILPNGSWITLDQFKGLNQIGETGLSDLINHHYLQVFGVSLAVGAIAGLGQNTRTGVDQSGLDAYKQGVTTSLSQSSLHILDRYLNVLPTITIREGQRVKVLLSGDLLLPAYGTDPF